MSFQAQRWTPPPATPRARETRSTPPMPQPRLLPLPGVGPEDVVLAPDGRVVGGVEGGAVFAVDPTDGAVEKITDTGGRPLGLHADPDGSLLICDFQRGLLRLDKPHGTLEVLVDEVDGQRLPFASNVVADSDGTIYFSSSTSRYPLDKYMGDILEGSHTGRLFRRTPDGKVETLLDELKFANGIVLAPDRSCVLVAETAGYRITRYWLTGPRAGTSDLLVENLPGFPDNMGLGSDGLAWVTLVTPRNPLLDKLLPLPGLIRRVVWSVPDALRPKPAKTVWVQAYDFDGNLVHDLQREPDNYAMVTGVAEQNGTIYLGSLTERAIAVTHLPG
ncbi:SMP-30/gluconolactonase/LRE family protein [Nocardia sp. CDC159]|uniref:SMP-30/gluconolactonase/LRE family protein n=1 Tax=Nocardia pulmonis TaxID=2951408 RepID=A0A9X2IWX9_9NOCA|nr:MULTISPECIES: SMP-30/gluconolactonase/LRE family protein [Nocardia]MCM6774039.1 SMP-30/gluconolactonase/LRE family protein [Nocardia pulmonis]MCM6786926.1 SMP-30/gluconolactonase/LRE family protein [Nocardia sp. CDC159]